MLGQSFADPRTSDTQECGKGAERRFRKRCIVDGGRCATRRGGGLAKGTSAGFRRIQAMARESSHEHGQLEQSKIATAKRDNERAVLLDDLSKAIASLKAAQQQIVTFEARIAELTSTLESRNQRLARSLSLSGLSDCAAAAVKTLRDRLARGDIQIAVDAAGGVHAVIANLDRPEMRTLSEMLTHRAWRVHVIRWLLRLRARP
jgi:hypothetical protein